MRSGLLRLIQRLPAGAGAQDGLQALRCLSTSSATDASSLLNTLQGKKQEQGTFQRVPQVFQPQLSFAAQMHMLSNKEEEEQKVPSSVATVPQIPKALTALPVQKRSLAMSRRAMGSSAHADASPFAAHPYHVLPPSQWPMVAGNGALLATMGMTLWFHGINPGGMLMSAGVATIVMSAISWWRDCIIESDMGMHTEVVKRNLVSGVWIFIASEAALFFALLWSCIHLGMAPNVQIQMQWPPVGIEAVGWDKRALVMSAVLAASYYSANVAMVSKDPKMVMAALATTVGFGALFLGDQYLEYNELPFTITDSAYGSTFFITTGFHGMHVLLGAIWLATSAAMYPRYNNVGVGMKGAVLYWHFVDIVWIAVYGIIYVAQL